MENRVIYIIGSGRSGTTLLDIILGNSDELFSAGELNRYTERNGMPTDVNSKEAGDFWNEILEDLAKENLTPPVDYSPLCKKYEHHFGLFRLLTKNEKDFNKYAGYQQKFFDILFKKVNSKFHKNLIIDSSKYPLRGYYLSKILGDKISYIYINRNPLAVVESFQKKDVEQDSKSKLMANLYLLTTNFMAAAIIKKLNKTHMVTTISYEDLLTKPISALNKIENDLNISLTTSKKLIENESSLQVGYLFDGNRLRLQKEIKLKKGKSTYSPKKLSDKIFYSIHKRIWYK